MSSKIKKLSKNEVVYDILRSRILNGTYPPGHRVTIDDIARELKLSNSPIREAINKLAAENFLKIIPYSGAVVQLVNENEYIEIMYVLGILDGVATSLSSGFMDENDIEHLKNINQQMNDALDIFDLITFSNLNRKFHLFIYSKCNNNFLINQLESIWQKISYGNNVRFTFAPVRAKESITEHEEIIKMLQEKTSADKIERFLRRHKSNMISAIKSK
ncbi:GntR family transcriptional regulator [Salmonella enterica subsp. enterica serovar Chester]|nr:GntR family transcriptional regulator [Salmonella enterica subsp. enterica serovar Chester]